MDVKQLKDSAEKVLAGVESADYRGLAQQQARAVLDLLKAGAEAELEHRRVLNETTARANAAYNDVLAERDKAQKELASGVADAFQSEAIAQVSALRGAAEAEVARLTKELSAAKQQLAAFDHDTAQRVERAADEIKQLLTSR